ncbi:hypothetical protein Tco_0242176 [Tanacetum coccineum]
MVMKWRRGGGDEVVAAKNGGGVGEIKMMMMAWRASAVDGRGRGGVGVGLTGWRWWRCGGGDEMKVVVAWRW